MKTFKIIVERNVPYDDLDEDDKLNAVHGVYAVRLDLDSDDIDFVTDEVKNVLLDHVSFEVLDNYTIEVYVVDDEEDLPAHTRWIDPHEDDGIPRTI